MVWEDLLPMIERGLQRGQADGTTAEHMLFRIIDGTYKLWAGLIDGKVVAGVVLSVREHDVGRKVFVHMLAGERMPEWADELQRLLLDFAGLVGAKCIEASCRPGLAKFLRGTGWRRKAIVMELR